MEHFEATTRGVQIKVVPTYVEERSNPSANHWFFAYHISIRNRSERTVQLLSRHWVITDANGEIEEVKGPGVVGEQPVLSPGSSFEYTSFCPLATPFGTMEGSYRMAAMNGAGFDAEIPRFTLAQPLAIN